ncbi:nitrate reductase molybdenum cofactor assembly chaperone [Geminicoccus roseus]|uniref:nitrate reductase molybdenum cofactor assembly chaperone n=1 Tax=Geminicoccus roseus TaxID=404900 RepID=UPI00041596DF|nr:nitrate reductase molybdenum cofactor assembly chaperone [Geminicoccus roseus]
MRMTLRAMSLLLGYPSAELQAHVGELRAALRAEGALPPEALRRLEPLLRSFETEDLLDLQAAYSELFDRSRALSLHLFEHVHGDSRERGQAMIDLGQQYVDRGFVMEVAELPDFLPMFLEFLSCSPPREAREWLGEPAHVLAVLDQRLSERDSPYAAVFHALLALASAMPDRAAVEELEQRTAPKAEKSIDEEWEDAPVNFGAPVPDHGGPTGVVAKIRAARRAVQAVIKS